MFAGTLFHLWDVITLIYLTLLNDMRLEWKSQRAPKGGGLGHEFTGTGVLVPNSVGVSVPPMYVG